MKQTDTDIEFIEWLFNKMGTKVVLKDKSLLAFERKHFFNDAGEIVRIVDYKDRFTATPDGARMHNGSRLPWERTPRKCRSRNTST